MRFEEYDVVVVGAGHAGAEAAAAAADSRDLSAEETRIVNTYFQAILEEE